MSLNMTIASRLRNRQVSTIDFTKTTSKYPPASYSFNLAIKTVLIGLLGRVYQLANEHVVNLLIWFDLLISIYYRAYNQIFVLIYFNPSLYVMILLSWSHFVNLVPRGNSLLHRGLSLH
jgi:hypothetical protein